jgi:adenylosuccinate synthase
MINGIDVVAVTKLDVLSVFEKIKVCIGYEINGKRIKSFPSNVEKLNNVEPVYETLDGWMEDISECKSYDELPQKTKEYLEFISNKANIKIEIISVGPKRKQTFFMNG